MLWLSVLEIIQRLPHEQRGQTAAGAKDGCGHGRYGRLLRRNLRLLQGNLYFLLEGEAYFHEPFQGDKGRV